MRRRAIAPAVPRPPPPPDLLHILLPLRLRNPFNWIKLFHNSEEELWMSRWCCKEIKRRGRSKIGRIKSKLYMLRKLRLWKVHDVDGLQFATFCTTWGAIPPRTAASQWWEARQTHSSHNQYQRPTFADVRLASFWRLFRKTGNSISKTILDNLCYDTLDRITPVAKKRYLVIFRGRSSDKKDGFDPFPKFLW